MSRFASRVLKSAIHLVSSLQPGRLASLAGLLLTAGAAAGAERHNILLIVADDFSTDGLRLYNTNAVSFPPMPAVERLAKSGLTFRNAYAYPTCSPARCTLLTGRYGFRTGIGYALSNPLGPSLSSNEFTIPKALNAAGSPLQHGMVGKWHLSFGSEDPNTLGGFSHFSGGILGELKSYTNWPSKYSNGVEITSSWMAEPVRHRIYTNYATTDNLKDATNWIQLQGSQPWFLWLAFNACHEPFHLPPAGMHGYTNLSGAQTNIDANPRPYYEAMAQSLDTSISNLLAFLGPQTSNTTIVFLGDNGTPPSVIQAPYATNQCKGTLYEGGIRIPLIISGPKVAGLNRSTDALVSTVDLYATLLELAGVNLAATLPTNLVFDSQSLMPLITNLNPVVQDRFILAENFDSTIPDSRAGRTVRNTRYKLILFNNGVQEMYDLSSDPYEHTNLLARMLTLPEQDQYRILAAKLNEWQLLPAPVVTNFVQLSDRFAVTASHASNLRCWLTRSENPAYPVWTTLTNVAAFTGDTSTRIADTNPPAGSAFYRFALRTVQASTNTPLKDWKDTD